MRNAVDSIPGYVERAVLLLLLVPSCLHQDKNTPCNLGSWRSRGWCRVELQAGVLSGRAKIMICEGAEAIPYFMRPTDGWRLTAGTGDFTCCTLSHVLDGRKVECDKEGVFR